MKGQYDEQKLTSYVLGELPADEAAELDYAVAADSALRMAVGEIEKFQGGLSGVLGAGKDKLLPRHRAAIVRAAKESSRRGEVAKLESHKQAKMIYFWPVASAAVIGLGIFVMTLVADPQNGDGAKSVASGSGAGDGKLKDGKGVRVLSLDATNASLSLISKAVRNEGRLPKKEEVQIDELLNAFPLNARETVASAKGCSIGAEVMACPWNPSASLVLVSLKGSWDAKHEVSLEFRDQPREGRFLGHSGDATKVTETIDSSGYNFVLVIEGNAGNTSNLKWSVDGVAAPVLELSYSKKTEVSEDAKFASLICAYGVWLSSDEPQSKGGEELMNLAREASIEHIAADRYDFIELVDQTVKLAAKSK